MVRHGKRSQMFLCSPTSPFFGSRGSHGSHAPDLDDGLLVLGAVVVDFVPVMNDVTSRRHRHGTVRIELFAGSHPPGARQYDEEAIVRMEVWAAHVTWQPFEANNVRARLARIAEQHGRFVGSGSVPHPFDVGCSFKINRGAVYIPRVT